MTSHETATAAKYLASRGYRIFPIAPGMKGDPMVKAWQNVATSDAANVAQWWPPGSQNNIGVEGGDGKLILDIDVKNGKDGRASLAALEAKHGALPPTYTVTTPSGGEHRYFAGPDVPNSSGRVGNGLDVKSDGGYVVGPWSYTGEIPGKQTAGYYRVEHDLPLAPAPAWLIALAGADQVKAGPSRPPSVTITDTQLADLRSALDHLTRVDHVRNYGPWSEIGIALLSLGDQGREIWCEWCPRAPGYGGPDSPDSFWDRNSRTTPKTDFKNIYAIARDHGWVNPNRTGDLKALLAAAGSYTLPAHVQAAPLSAPAGGYTLPIPPAQAGIEIESAANIKPERIRWLWVGWLPSGKLIILAGAPGTGKSTITFSLAALVSRGAQWPDNAPACIASNVIIWSGEDDAADTIVPRLMAAGADLNRVHIIRGKVGPDGKRVAFDPSTDLPQLEQGIEQMGGAALLIIDPVVSAVAGDMNKSNEVRRSLQSLVDLGAKFDCAVIGITHFRKGSQGAAPNERVLGSQAFGALARVVLVAAENEEDGNRVLARAKSNISKDRGGIYYSLTPVAVGDNISTIRIDWGDAVEGTAREILKDAEREPETMEEGECAQALSMALRDANGNGIEVPKQVVEAQLKHGGFSEKQIRRAREKLRIVTWLEGFGPACKGMWKLPEGPP